MMHPTLLSLALLLPFFLTAASHNPASLISISCGTSAISVAANGREWAGDLSPKVSSMLLIKGSSTASAAIHSLTSGDPVPQKTARISRSRFSYAFQVSPGQKIIRLHFNSVLYTGFKRFTDLFTVEAGPSTLLSNFSASLTANALGLNTFTKEFCISLEENQTLSITFSPVRSSQSGDATYAFINGIEIISVPTHLSYFKGGDTGAQVVGQKSLFYINNSTALELTCRQNVKPNPVSLTDEIDDMLGKWGEFPKPKKNEIKNLTWRTHVDVGFWYLVRIHFCDLGLQLPHSDGVIFKVLINELIVDTNLDIVKGQDEHGILWFRDYVVAMKGWKQEGKHDLLISLRLYDELDGHKLIKGFEIFKLSNHGNSLACPNALPPTTDSLSWIILFQGNATANIIITVLTLINIIVYKLREIWEASSMEEENRPSAKAERLCRRFSLSEIQVATRNFSEAFVLGKGGFGKVYKGIIDNGGETVAVKRLKSNSKQGKHEFLTEIETLSELRHINLVSLIGYCNDQREMILVYEYMPCGTLSDHLYRLERNGNNSSCITWKQRLNTCIGAGRGLDYLHTGHGIIHRDVKTSNILLDENFTAKVSDLGLAKHEDRSRLQSHVSTNVKGTFGYIDPYYFTTRKLTRESDTYAFGVVLLEVLCGRQAMDPKYGEDEYCLTRWARNKINEGEVDHIVDSSLRGEILHDSLKIFVEVVENCLHDEPKKRPTMAQVVVRLEFALEQQDSRKLVLPSHNARVANDVCPSNQDIMTTEQSTEAGINVRTVRTSPPTEKTNINHTPAVENNGRKPKAYKPSRFFGWDVIWDRLKSSKKKEIRLISEIREDIKLQKFDLTRIAAATNQFSPSQKIGEGRFGSVYKAVLPTGHIVAVKRFSLSRPILDEFKSEILLVSGLHHQHIIKLLGYGIHKRGGMLAYEFMENGSFDDFILDEARRQKLQWSQRFKIIKGVAKGVSYLHHESGQKIIHRDLKSANILLDIEMNPKISGFGIARSFEDDQSELDTMVAGTIGYIAPEYVAQGRISEKIDVYSFGVVVLEILSGKRNMGYPKYDLNLIEHSWKLWNEGNALELIDESLRGAFSEEEAVRCIQVGLLCTQYRPHLRPTMPSVLKMLLGEDLSLKEKMDKAKCVQHIEHHGIFNVENAYPEPKSSLLVSTTSK